MRKLAFGLMLVIFTSLSAGLVAQEDTWYMGKPIANVVFTGLDRIKASELEGIVKPFINKPLSDEIFNDLQRRLYEMEEFEYVQADPRPFNGSKELVLLVFTVVERPGIEVIEFRGNEMVRSPDLLDQVSLRIGKTLSPGLIAADVDSLRKYYLDNGYANVEVSSQVEAGTVAGRKKLVFIINEGFKTSVRKILFKGISFATEGTLKGLMKTVEQSLFNLGLYQTDVLEHDRDALLKYYRDSGYVDARITDIEKTVEHVEADHHDYLTVTISLDEGRLWTYGGITLVGNQIFSNDDLLGLTKMKVGAVLNASKFQADFQAIADRYYKDGYINNSIRLSEQRDQDAGIVNYTITIVEYGRAYVEDIIIKGNTKTKDHVILRELPVEEGDVFSSSKITLGLQNLYGKRYFSNIQPETPAGSAQGLYNLVLNVTEQNTTNMSVGLALSGSDTFPLSAIFNWSDSNFLGNGQEFSLEANLSPNIQKLAVSFSDPWLFGKRWGGGISMSFKRELLSGVAQDILYPVFDTNGDSSDAVPDPFTGAYVFSTDTQYPAGSGLTYAAGDYFPGNPTADDIANYDLVTDYVYAGGSSGIPADYSMEYINWDVGLSFNTSFKARTPIGWFVTGASLSFSLNYVDYDPTIYRPFDQELRENLKQFVFINRFGLSVGLDGRDISYDPSNGYYINESMSFTGGLMGGARNYIRSDTTLQGFLTLWNVPVGEESFFKTVLAANSSLSVLLPEFFDWNNENTFKAAGYYLYTSPSLIARGWPARKNGEALINNWVEFRTPLIPGTLSFDIYGEAVQFVENRDELFAASSDWMCGFGAGLRLTMQQLPLRLYIGKRFDVKGDGSVELQKGNLFYSDDKSNPDGVDVILTFSLN